MLLLFYLVCFQITTCSSAHHTRNECQANGCPPHSSQGCYEDDVEYHHWKCAKCPAGHHPSEQKGLIPSKCRASCERPRECLQPDPNIQCWKCKCPQYELKNDCKRDCNLEQKSCMQMGESGCWECEYSFVHSWWFRALVLVAAVFVCGTGLFPLLVCCWAARTARLRSGQK